MNPFTAFQLMNKTSPSAYYDTKDGTMKLSLVPIATAVGHDVYDVKMPQKDSYDKNSDVKNKKRNNTPVKITARVRKTNEVPDELRCCVVKADGTRCCLKKYSEHTTCYVHAQHVAPKPEPHVTASCETNIKNKPSIFNLFNLFHK